MRLNIGVLASGRGSNFLAIINSIKNGELDAMIKVLITDNCKAGAIDIARENNIETADIEYDKTDRSKFEAEAIDILDEMNCDLIVLAGFMRILTPYFIEHYKDRILNIHPSLLPAFRGMNAQKQALEYGVKITGCTVHIVTENLDDGLIIAQRTVPVFEGDSLKQLEMRILREEHKLYPYAIKKWNYMMRENLLLENNNLVKDEVLV